MGKDRAHSNYRFRDGVNILPLVTNFTPLGSWVMLEDNTGEDYEYITVHIDDRIIVNKGMDHIIKEWQNQGLLERKDKIE